MTSTDLLDVWEFPRDFLLAKIADVALDRLAPPVFRAHLVSSRGDVITVQLAGAGSPTEPTSSSTWAGGARSRFFVARSGRADAFS